ncbi:TIGR02757 family protein [Tenacibaculum sp. IB213877]|uniref:TIGR02757 family protein n=1 Tax=Tenacibaculum sp. IB213877 TaxID=3097351 RepID=UPI002A5A3003|nr:TIGR02757 family protein [Tenacibaculum sp. IB213877]MDY0779926.1 TIGR02757 family protein [Tenacibaculum sp. IB213877]
MNKNELKDFLDEKADFYENLDFIESDPIQIPHSFTQKEDIEIAAFLSASIAWGNRKMIINNATRMMDLLGNSPFDFVLNHTEEDLADFDGFVHRTFNADDFKFFVQSLKNIYQNHGGLEELLRIKDGSDNYKTSIHNFKKVFFEIPHLPRIQKHVSDPMKGSASKRINMFLRWMVRNGKKGVDFGIWNSHYSAHLHCPLDVHTGNVARKLSILQRKQNDWKAIQELDVILREFDKNDPVKYDFALFGLGVFEKF